MEELTLRQARELLAEYAAVLRSRDDRVRTTFAAGLSKSEIHRLTGIARTTIDAILAPGPSGPTTAQEEVTRA